MDKPQAKHRDQAIAAPSPFGGAAVRLPHRRRDSPARMLAAVFEEVTATARAVEASGEESVDGAIDAPNAAVGT